MKELAKTYPQYGWEKNAGYGTKDHIKAIEQYGITSIHRRSYAPIKRFLEGQSVAPVKKVAQEQLSRL